MTRHKLILSLSTLAAMASCATPSAPAVTTAPPVSVEAKPPAETSAPQRTPKLGSFGVDLAGIEPSVRPGHDFYTFAGARWLKNNQIPADRSRWGMFDALREEADVNVRKLLDEQAAAKGDVASNVAKAASFYTTYVDTAAIDARGFEPVKADLAAIAAAKNHEAIAKLMALPELGLPSPIRADVTIDEKDPDRYAVAIGHSGLGLPEREFYLKDGEQFQEIRKKYEQHMVKVLTMVGDKKAAANAAAILALETKIAECHWPIADRRERDKTYNPRTLLELTKESPAFPWKLYLSTAGYGGEKKFIVAENTAMPKLAKLFSDTPVAQWKAYLTYHLLRSGADVLPTTLDDEVFDFHGRTLNGQPEKRERWKRGVLAVNEALGDAVGELYVARYFQPKAKAQMDRLVENLRQAYAIRIQKVDWMTPATKKVALEKLATFRPKIGYPAKWKSYDKLAVNSGDAYGNSKRAAVWSHEYFRDKLGKPTDRDEWFMSPQTVNAYYNATFNEIVFPAAILQPPFFDPEADDAVNYGAIGGVIGHEMGHGFDDQGAKSDAMGVLRTWWAPADVDAFKARTDALAEQYAAFEPLPGMKVNGRLTLGENIGDIGGLAVSYQAYQISLNDAEAPAIDSYSGDQRFFLGWAQVWRTLYREQALRNQVMTDPHSPAMYRVNGVVRNLDAWYVAFDVKKDDPLYLAPEQRIRIW